MLTKSYRTLPLNPLFENFFQLFSCGLFILLIALPSLASAATPWYSYGKSHTLTLTEKGTVWALGSNDFGQLGNGSFGGETLEPRIVKGLDTIIAVVAGSNHSVALRKDGTVWTWGSNNSGQLGDGTLQDSAVPAMVAGLSNVTAISSGSGHVVALKQDGTVWAWGGNHSGQIGNGKFQNCKTPTLVSGVDNVKSVVAGAYNSFALKNDGTLWSWGFNGAGQLGNGGNERSSTPVRVSGLENVRAVAAGQWHVAALKQDGSVWAWGSNRDSQLGTTTASYSYSPMQVSGVSNISDITASVGHTIAIAKNDSVWAWGDAGTGQWGNGISMDGSVSPVPVSSYNGPVTVAAIANPDSILRDRDYDPTTLVDAGTRNSTISQTRNSEIFITASR